jgi:DNA repair exonuclease SbcCD ATPase subunit
MDRFRTSQHNRLDARLDNWFKYSEDLPFVSIRITDYNPNLDKRKPQSYVPMNEVRELFKRVPNNDHVLSMRMNHLKESNTKMSSDLEQSIKSVSPIITDFKHEVFQVPSFEVLDLNSTILQEVRKEQSDVKELHDTIKKLSQELDELKVTSVEEVEKNKTLQTEASNNVKLCKDMLSEIEELKKTVNMKEINHDVDRTKLINENKILDDELISLKIKFNKMIKLNDENVLEATKKNGNLRKTLQELLDHDKKRDEQISESLTILLSGWKDANSRRKIINKAPWLFQEFKVS